MSSSESTCTLFNVEHTRELNFGDLENCVIIPDDSPSVSNLLMDEQLDDANQCIDTIISKYIADVTFNKLNNIDNDDNDDDFLRKILGEPFSSTPISQEDNYMNSLKSPVKEVLPSSPVKAPEASAASSSLVNVSPVKIPSSSPAKAPSLLKAPAEVLPPTPLVVTADPSSSSAKTGSFLKDPASSSAKDLSLSVPLKRPTTPRKVPPPVVTADPPPVVKAPNPVLKKQAPALLKQDPGSQTLPKQSPGSLATNLEISHKTRNLNVQKIIKKRNPLQNFKIPKNVNQTQPMNYFQSPLQRLEFNFKNINYNRYLKKYLEKRMNLVKSTKATFNSIPSRRNHSESAKVTTHSIPLPKSNNNSKKHLKSVVIALNSNEKTDSSKKKMNEEIPEKKEKKNRKKTKFEKKIPILKRIHLPDKKPNKNIKSKKIMKSVVLTVNSTSDCSKPPVLSTISEMDNDILILNAESDIEEEL